MSPQRDCLSGPARPRRSSSRPPVLATAALILGLLATPSPALAQQTLEIQFIANMAVRLSDGTTTLVSDFPYRSGYAGYMTWSLEGIGSLEGATAFITHEHADHWERELWNEMQLSVVADPAITAGLDPSRVRPWGESIRVGAATIHPVRTPHTGAHHSYRLSWGGLELYFTGDTESTAELLAQTDLDVAFVSPWLLSAVARTGRRIDADLIVIYHHTDPDEPQAVPASAWVPHSGEVLRLPFPR